MADPKPLTPSPTLVEMLAVTREQRSGSPDSPAGRAEMVTRISDDVADSLGTAKWTHVGWAMFAVAAQLQLNSEAWVGRAKASIPRAQILEGVRGAAQVATRAGEALISRGKQGPPVGEGAFSVDAQLTEARPRLVDGARSVLGSIVPAAEQLDQMMAVIRGTEEGAADATMVRQTTRALPGLDGVQAGWGLFGKWIELPRLGGRGRRRADATTKGPAASPTRKRRESARHRAGRRCLRDHRRRSRTG